MSAGHKVVDEVFVGGSEQIRSEWQTIRATFRNFAQLPSKRGDMTESLVLECHGLKWTIQLFPGGDTNSKEDEVFCSLFLCSKSCSEGNSIKVAKTIRIPSAGRSVGSRTKSLNHSTKFPSWGFSDYKLRSVVLDPSKNYLVNGDLTVEVDVRVMLDKPPTWTPTNTLSLDMLKLLDAADADNSDVVFETMGTEKKPENGKKWGDENFFAPFLCPPDHSLGPMPNSCSLGRRLFSWLAHSDRRYRP